MALGLSSTCECAGGAGGKRSARGLGEAWVDTFHASIVCHQGENDGKWMENDGK